MSYMNANAGVPMDISPEELLAARTFLERAAERICDGVLELALPGMISDPSLVLNAVLNAAMAAEEAQRPDLVQRMVQYAVASGIPETLFLEAVREGSVAPDVAVRNRALDMRSSRPTSSEPS